MYLKEQLPWVILFVFFNISILVIGLIDTAIPNISLFYIVMINTMVLILFVVWDYIRKRELYKDVQSLNQPEDIDSLHHAKTPFQQEMNTNLEKVRRNHQELLEAESSKTRENLDELTRFVHDMKMPITTMILMIQDTEESQRARLMAEMNRLESMLNEILYLKRLPNISNDLYIEKVYLESLFNYSIQKIRHICMKKGIGFEMDISIDYVESDIKWLQFIIDQLLSNSVKYSENTNIYIHAFKEGGHDIIQIIDYGRGIKSEDISRIFESGFTSTSDHDNAQSTGMGLYLSKNVAEVLNISLELTSEYQQGTTATLKFSKQNEFNHLTSM